MIAAVGPNEGENDEPCSTFKFYLGIHVSSQLPNDDSKKAGAYCDR